MGGVERATCFSSPIQVVPSIPPVNRDKKMATPNGLNPTFDQINAKKPIISATTLDTTTITVGSASYLHPAESGSLVLLDGSSGGTIMILPDPESANAGIVYDFIVTTSGAYKIVTDSASTYLVGSVLSVDTDTGNGIAMFCTAGGTEVALTVNGTTTGGLAGSRYRVTSTSATSWLIEGVNYGSGTVDRPFANS